MSVSNLTTTTYNDTLYIRKKKSFVNPYCLGATYDELRHYSNHRR